MRLEQKKKKIQINLIAKHDYVQLNLIKNFLLLISLNYACLLSFDKSF